MRFSGGGTVGRGRGCRGWLGLLVGLALLVGIGPGFAGERILLFAPHPDDECISLGGWLADEIASGSAVWAAIVTDGARLPRAVRARTRKPSLLCGPRDFRKLGRLRRQEAWLALERLGVPAAHRIFLGYPSGGLATIYQTPRWETLVKCRALGLRFGVAEWGGKKETHAFSRRALVEDLGRLLALASPSLIVLPVPFDSNPDHQAVARLVMERLAHVGSQARVMGYLVHRGSRKRFPRPFGYRPTAGLWDPPSIPPPKRYFPSTVGMTIKERAIRCHRSQLDLRDGFLLSFIRREELWWPLSGGKTGGGGIVAAPSQGDRKTPVNSPNQATRRPGE